VFAPGDIGIYEPTSNGGLRLIGADYLILVEQWNADKKHTAPPELMGQAFYSLHVWAWKDNPNGAFVNWHPNVSYEPFTGKDDPDSRQ
jgi:hypothetical protein